MADFCYCDGHGSCGEYNSSRFAESELLYHKEWTELYDSKIGEFKRSITVCYCDTGWTGYSDIGTFHSEVLQNCAISKAAMTVLWTISLVCFALLTINMIQRGITQREYDRGIRAKSRNLVRFVPTIAFFGITVAKLKHINEPWFVTIGVSPGMTIAFLFGMLCFTFDITETQHKHVHRYFANLFKDFGFGDRVKVDKVRIVRNVKIQQICMAFSVTFYVAAVMYGNHTTCVAAVIVYHGITLIVLLVDVLIVDPKTNARFLVVLKRMIDVNTDSQHKTGKHSTSSQNQIEPSSVRINSASIKANDRMQEVYTKVAMMNRTKRIQTFLFVLSCMPFYSRHWWKYLAYHVAWNTIVHSVAKTFVYFMSLKRSRKRQRLIKLQVVKRADSSEVSAFKSSK